MLGRDDVKHPRGAGWGKVPGGAELLCQLSIPAMHHTVLFGSR